MLKCVYVFCFVFRVHLGVNFSSPAMLASTVCPTNWSTNASAKDLTSIFSASVCSTVS